MKKIKKIGITFYIIIMSVLAIIVYVRAYIRISARAFQKTTEEYIAVLTDNREDFEYVAKTMLQWHKGHIFFADGYGRYYDFEDILIIKNSEIKSEMSNNDKFYNSLYNIYNLGEIDSISISGYSIDFDFIDPPKGCEGYLAYMKVKRKRHIQIDEDWDLIIHGHI